MKKKESRGLVYERPEILMVSRVKSLSLLATMSIDADVEDWGDTGEL